MVLALRAGVGGAEGQQRQPEPQERGSHRQRGRRRKKRRGHHRYSPCSSGPVVQVPADNVEVFCTVRVLLQISKVRQIERFKRRQR